MTLVGSSSPSTAARTSAATATATDAAVAPVTLSVSIVVFHPDLPLLRDTCRSLGAALRAAHESGLLSGAAVDAVDNGGSDPVALREVMEEVGNAGWLRVRVHHGGGNVGYGRGHNAPMLASDANFHLVLNPDVRIAPDALVEAIRYMRAHGDVGLLTPRVSGPVGELQRLCRRYPSLLVLYLRGFAPAALRRRLRSVLDEYEMANVIGEEEVRGVPLASGCFMFLRTDVARAVGGFSPEYFLYFEDHDLSLKVGARADIAYVPRVRIVHHGGGASRKGVRHVLLYVSSARRFFARHGWRLW